MKACFSYSCTIFAPMENAGKNRNVSICFEKIVGVMPPERFGEPFISALSALYKGGKDEIEAASYICSLFLSAILLGFPTSRMHLFVHCVQENYSRFSFNCKMYDTIFALMKEDSLSAMVLLDADSRAAICECRKEDVFEALDFYTNR